MPSRYYQLSFDSTAWPRWFPGEPITGDGRELDARLFTSCTTYTGEPLILPTVEPGPRSPITFGPFDVPVVDVGVAKKLRAVADDAVQLVPAVALDERVYVLNVLQRRYCIDTARTVGDRWTASDGRPEKLGEYRTIVKLFVDPACAAGAPIFRLGGWEVALIVSDEVAEVLDEHERDGIVLEPVA